MTGSSEPLPALVGRLTTVMTSADGGQPITEMLVQNTILELASRKSYGVKDGASWHVQIALEGYRSAAYSGL